MGTLEEHRLSKRANQPPHNSQANNPNLTPTTMKWTVIIACALVVARAAPVAEPEAFSLPAIAIPSLTGMALIDGLLLGKVAFLKAAVLSSLLLGASDSGEDSYGAPAVEYGAPAVEYGAPAPTYEEPAVTYDAPATSYEEPHVDTYGPPQAPPVDEYGSPQAAPVSYHSTY